MKKYKKLIALVLVIVATFAVSTPVLAYMYVYVNVPAGQTLNIRDWPDGNVVFTLKRGDMVDMQAYADPVWSKIIVPGKGSTAYYCKSEFLSPNPPSPAWQDRYGVPNLQYAPNTYNSYVVNLQKDLRAAGYTSITNADGYFGTITQTAVKNFQKNNGLTQDGIVGNMTKQALWNKLHP